VLEGIDAFDVTLQLAGRLSQPDIRIESDMDDLLSAGLKRVIEQQQTALKSRLKREISQRTEDEIGAVKSGFSGFQGIERELENRLEFGSDLLNELPGNFG